MPHEQSAFVLFTKLPPLEVVSNFATRSPPGSCTFAQGTEVAILRSLRQIVHETSGGIVVVLAERFRVEPFQRRKSGRKSESSKQTSIAQAVRPSVSRGIFCPETRAAEYLYPNHWIKPHIRDVALKHCTEVATNNSAGCVRTQNKT